MLSLLARKALFFAALKHTGQYRKGVQVPYIVHPVQVAFGVSKYTGDDEVISAAFLHDVLEDCHDVSVDMLEKEFNTRIAHLVDEVSILRGNTYVTWKEKKVAYLEKIKHASKNALLIIAIDKMSNLQAYFEMLKNTSGKTVSGFGGTPDEYRWYYTEIENILLSKLPDHPVTKDYSTIWQSYKK